MVSQRDRLGPLTAEAGCTSPFNRRRARVFNLEHDDLPDRLAFVQSVEADVDLVELEPAAHQAIDRQFAAAVKLNVARYIAVRHAGADVTALHRALLGHEIDLRQREGVSWRRYHSNGGVAAATCDLISKVHCAHRTGHLERKLDSAAGRRTDFFDSVGSACVERVGGAELPREAELVVRQVNG